MTAFALPLLSVSAALLGVGVLFLMPHQLRNLKLAPVADFMSQHALAFKLSGGITIALGILLATAVLTRSANNLGHLASEPKRFLSTQLMSIGYAQPTSTISLNGDDLYQCLGEKVLVVHMDKYGSVSSVDLSSQVYYAAGDTKPYILVPVSNSDKHTVYTLRNTDL